MDRICLLLFSAVSLATGPSGSVDVSSLRFGSPSVLVEFDSETVQGDMSRLAWSPDGNHLYLQTSSRKPPLEELRHYTIAVEGAGARVETLESEPDWAESYWRAKQDRAAPGLPSLIIQVEQRQETIKQGTGPSGVLDRAGNATSIASSGPDPDNLARGTLGYEKARVVRLSFAGQEIALFVNEPKPSPGTRFSWGPVGSGALVFLGEKGELIFLDAAKHKRQVPQVKGAFLPAWSVDGTRVAYVRRTGRSRFAVMSLAVTSSRPATAFDLGTVPLRRAT